MSLSSQCAECGEGMVCPGMGSVTLNPGYFALLEDPANVWACHGVQERCPGGAPGTYAENRPNTSIACGDCKSSTRATTSGPCADCQATDVLLLVGLLLVFFGLCVVYRVIASEDRAKQKLSIVFKTIVTSQTVTGARSLRPYLRSVARALRHQCGTGEHSEL